MITQEQIKKIWLTDNAIFIETISGEVAHEKFADYQNLKNATHEQRQKFTTSAVGIHWQELDEDLSFSGFFTPKNKPTEIGQILRGLYGLNISALARRLGISQPLMASYLSGAKTPSPQRKQQIQNELHKFADELKAVRL